MRYVIAAMAALYLNVFVLVVQLFEKVPRFRALAPTQSEAPFLVTQGFVLGIFVMVFRRCGDSVPSGATRRSSSRRKSTRPSRTLATVSGFVGLQKLSMRGGWGALRGPLHQEHERNHDQRRNA